MVCKRKAASFELLFGNANQLAQIYGGDIEGNATYHAALSDASSSRQGEHLMWHLAGLRDKEVLVECVLGLAHPLWVYELFALVCCGCSKGI